MYNEYYNTQQNSCDMVQPKKKKGTIIVGIIIAILLLMCCCCAGCPLAMIGSFQNTFTETFGETVEMEIDDSDISNEWVTNTEYTDMLTSVFDLLGLKNTVIYEDGNEEDMIIGFASEENIGVSDFSSEFEDFEYIYTNNGEWVMFEQYDESNDEYSYIYMSTGEDTDLTYVFIYYPQTIPDFDSIDSVLEIVEEDCYVLN